MGNAFFHFKQFSILNQEKGLKVTTDACLLGTLAKHPDPLLCLDIGCGSGILSLFLAQRYAKAKITAIEIEKTVFEQACININASPFKNRIETTHVDFLKYEPLLKFDLMVCNPPYFKHHLQKANDEKNRAIHNLSLPIPELFLNARKALSDTGRFFLILPPYEAGKAVEQAQLAKLMHTEEILIFNQVEKHFRTILCFMKESQLPLTSQTIWLKDEDGNDSEEFRLLMREFYLENTDLYKSKG